MKIRKPPPGEDGVERQAWERINWYIEEYLHQAWAGVIILALAWFVLSMPAPARLAAWRALVAQRYLAGMLLSFSLLTLSLLWSAGQRLDAWVFLYFNVHGRRPRWLDRAMYAFTQLGNGFVALVFATYAWTNSDRLLAERVALGSLTLWLVVELVKALVRRPRPSMHLAQTRIVGMRPIGRSFPSGHTSQAFFLATLLSQHFGLQPGLVLALYLAAVLVGITRMYVGAHYPRDVLAGAVLGVLWGMMAFIV